jgi:DNA-binding IclR family transcriptional regulator
LDIEERLDDLRLDTSAFQVLCYLSFKDAPMKPREIAREIGQNPSTVRARLAELKNKGLVVSKPQGYVSALNPYDILMKLYRDIKKETRG